MKAICTLFVSALAALSLAACGGGEGEAPPTPSRTLAATSEDQIREVLDRLAEANSQEDSSAAYEIYAPTLREICEKDDFRAVRDFNFRSDKLLIGEIAWEALKEDLADGYEVRSVEVVGDRATAVVLENDEPLTFVREEGQWWFYEEGPCEVTLFEDIEDLFGDGD